jgi:hypothetical protein
MKYKLHLYPDNLPALICLLFRTVVPYFTTLFLKWKNFTSYFSAGPALIIKCVNYLLINAVISYYGIKFGYKECGPIDGLFGPVTL